MERVLLTEGSTLRGTGFSCDVVAVPGPVGQMDLVSCDWGRTGGGGGT